MIKTFVPIVILGAASLALAQEPAPAPAAATRTPRIAVINMETISAESILGKGYASQIQGLEKEIQTEGTKKQTELAKMDAAIKGLQDELDKQAAVLSPEAAERKRQDIVKKTRERQAYVEDGQQDLQRMRESAEQKAQGLNAEFQQKIKPHIDAVAKEKGIDIILTSQVALTLNREFDISRDVITKADAAERAAQAAKPAAAKPAAAAAPPAAAPPAAAAPAPSPAAPKPTPTPQP
jgi:Skp family chaperone for outer membrane proteins